MSVHDEPPSGEIWPKPWDSTGFKQPADGDLVTITLRGHVAATFQDVDGINVLDLDYDAGMHSGRVFIDVDARGVRQFKNLDED